MGWKDKFSKEKLRGWAEGTRSQILVRSQILGPKIRDRFEKMPALLVLLGRLPRYQLVLAGLGAFLLADLAMLGLGSYLSPTAPPPRRGSRRVVELEARLLPKNNYNATLRKNIFCPGCPIPDLEIKRIERPKDCNNAIAATTGTKLIGTIVLSDPRHSVATITSGSDSIAVQQGDTIPGSGTVFEIRRNKVCIVDAADQLIFIDLPEEDIRLGQPIAGAARSSPQAAARSAVPGIEQASETEFNISRNTLLEKLADPNLLFQAHAVPHRGANGEIEGFKILSLQPGSVYESLGVKVGDLIQSVDGEPMNSIAKAQEFYMSARTASDLTLSVQRDGRNVDLRYSIK
jgi:general secretion pathway protein C